MVEALEAHLRRQIDHSRRFFWQRLRWRLVRSYLPSYTSFTLVDVGAGAGLLGQFLAKDRPRATYAFVEPIDSLREFLRGQYGASADLTGQEGLYRADFVTLLDVLEHQQDDRSFLRDLITRMAPGTTLLLTVPALQDLWSPWDVALGHFRRYEKSTLLRSTEGLPLIIREISFIFPEMVPLGKIRARQKAQDSPEGESSEFPDLPGVVNDALYGLGSASLALRRRWRTGTSLFLAATVDSPNGVAPAAPT